MIGLMIYKDAEETSKGIRGRKYLDLKTVILFQFDRCRPVSIRIQIRPSQALSG